MQVGEEITIEPAELVAGGDALARVDGFPVFVSNVFPGDVAVVRLFEVKKGFARADVVRIERPSPLRRLAPCPVAGECGGCNWTALRLDAQLDAKRRILTESLRRVGKFDVAALPAITTHPSPLNYRLRSHLHQASSPALPPKGRPEAGTTPGFYAMRSNRVVPLPPECEVVGVETAHHPAPGKTWEIDGQIIRGEREITLRVSEYRYRLSTAAFFQVNRHLHATMLDLVRAHAARVKQKQTAIDIYAGVGFFTLPLAGLFERVIAIEGSPVSSRFARMNAAANVEIVEAPAERAQLPGADFIFLDPPRAGARKEVISAVGEKAREMICYLSCDPVTFARDASRLTASGWRLSTLDLLDLFPNTHHVETLSSFERAP